MSDSEDRRRDDDDREDRRRDRDRDRERDREDRRRDRDREDRRRDRDRDSDRHRDRDRDRDSDRRRDRSRDREDRRRDRSRDRDRDSDQDMNGEDDEETIEPIGTYAVIPEDPPIVLGPANAIEKKIIKQVEYYFSDINLCRDRFLQDQIREDPDGWVSIAILTKFNRLKALTSNLKMIGTALRKSESGLLEVSKDGVYTRRSPEKPLPENTEELRNGIEKRTAYAKGFPDNVSLDKLITYFEAEHGPVDTVFMRRDPNRKFKGSVFVTFTCQDDANKFILTTDVKYDGEDLNRMTKEKYFEIKFEEKKKKRQEKIQRKKEELKKKEEEERQKVIESMTKGAWLHLNGFSDETEREDIKNYFSDHGTVAWVDFDMGDKEAFVRFEEENKASEAMQAAKDANEGKIVIKEAELECRIVEGEEEIQRWVKFFRDLEEKRREQKKRKSEHRHESSRHKKRRSRSRSRSRSRERKRERERDRDSD